MGAPKSALGPLNDVLKVDEVKAHKKKLLPRYKAALQARLPPALGTAGVLGESIGKESIFLQVSLKGDSANDGLIFQASKSPI